MARKTNIRSTMTTREAGQMGGRKTAKKYGKEFYQTIGKKGGQTVKRLIQKGKKTLGIK